MPRTFFDAFWASDARGKSAARPVITTPRLYLRLPVMGDWADWARLRAQSREFLIPWEPAWGDDDLTRPAFRDRLRRYRGYAQEGLGFALFLFCGSQNILMGGVTISNIRRGAVQSATIGYWMGSNHAGQGYMTEAVGALIPFLINDLQLHRIEAACVPENERSIRLLLGQGFMQEGLARNYIRINGHWRDHLLFAYLPPDSDA